MAEVGVAMLVTSGVLAILGHFALSLFALGISAIYAYGLANSGL